jgi:uncharacterized protein YbcC (UPF0753/DUF2309 family)
MNAPHDATARQALQLAQAIDEACGRIAPAWPLDRSIAVNPYWGWRAEGLPATAARLALLAGTRLTAPRDWWQAEHAAGRLNEAHLQAAAREAGGDLATRVAAMQALLAAAPGAPEAAAALPLLSSVRDRHDGSAGARRAGSLPRWSDLLRHQLSQHCAAFFDTDQSRWQLDRAGGLYGSWRRQLAADRGLPWRRGRGQAQRFVEALPAEPLATIAQGLESLRLPAHAHAGYLTALLMDIGGWAAWCAWLRWEAALTGSTAALADGAAPDALVHLLAARLAWEGLLQHDADAALADAAWLDAWCGMELAAARLSAAQRADLDLQRAAEIAWQQPLADALVRPRGSALARDDGAAPAASAPQVQAVFCIDVRSEVLRRAVEAVDPCVHTRGFAGFFGLPLAYRPAGTALERPQLPGLLSPAWTASEPTDGDGTGLGQRLRDRRAAALAWRRRWAELRSAAASGFSFVEACGLAYGARLLTGALPGTAPPPRWEDAGLPAGAPRPAPELPAAATADPDALAGTLQTVLHAMGLPDRAQGLAPLVLLAGHGSHSANNPHAAGLDCGACGGQTGEVNARVLAGLLNQPVLRRALARRGVVIPDGTWFVAALHDTTTDDVRLFGADDVPGTHRDAVQRLQRTLAQAGHRARAERATGLDGAARAATDDAARADAIRRRANDWAQVRPEWGLAGNAAFVVAPRERTRGLKLDGRVFLHDYDAAADADGAVLTLILTAPMVVTNWINLQYHASVVDPQRFGSGNKLLHNVVGGRIGVFEGNGGDLRIGLPWQSVHDGQRLRHAPLRLAVFVEAPAARIDAVIEAHAVVRELVLGGWLQLMRIDAAAGLVERRGAEGWVRFAAA